MWASLIKAQGGVKNRLLYTKKSPYIQDPTLYKIKILYNVGWTLTGFYGIIST